MKIAHISDLHLGKTLHNFSLIEDQEYILNQIVQKIIENKVEVLLVAGDIYDKNVAPEAGIKLFRKFLNDLVNINIKVMVISGNHDSAERLTFGGEFMTDKGIFFSKVYDGNIEPIVLKDENGSVNFYLLPFIKPSIVQHYFPDEKIESYEDAVSCAVKQMELNSSERNIIVAHQNILSAERCESEENVIGGLDAVSDQIFKDFDYVALGHIHKQQEIGKSKVMFSGTPLKYSVSELDHNKVMPVITLGKKSEKDIELVPLVPKRELRQIKATFDEIMKNSKNDPYNAEDFIDVILTDENDVLDAISTLRSVYPNILKITYDNKATKAAESVEKFDAVDEKKPLDVFEAFYKARRGTDMDDMQKEYIQSLIENIWGEN